LVKLDEKTQRVLDIIGGLMDRIKGRNEIQSYLQPFLDPNNPQTTSNLTPGQVNYVQDTHWISEIYPEFSSMKKSSEHLLVTRISLEGFGVKESVKLVSALGKTKETKETSVIEKVKDKVKTQ